MTTTGTQVFSVRSNRVLQWVGAAFGKAKGHCCTFWYPAALTYSVDQPCSNYSQIPYIRCRGSPTIVTHPGSHTCVYACVRFPGLLFVYERGLLGFILSISKLSVECECLQHSPWNVILLDLYWIMLQRAISLLLQKPACFVDSDYFI